MPTLDDQLRDKLRRAAPLPGGADDLGERIASRRRRHAAQRRASRVALVALVLVGTIAGVAALDRAFRGRNPIVSQPPDPNPTLGEDGGMSLEGVPFRVCRPMSIPGEFGAGVDTLWIFEEEPAAGAGCADRGELWIAVGTATSVSAMSERGALAEQLESASDGTAPWPYAAVDIDGNGVDEIALGVGGSLTDGYARIVLLRVMPAGLAGSPGEVRSVVFDCGPDCELDIAPWIGLGTFVENLSGAYCETSALTGQPALIRWSAGQGVVEGVAWYLEGQTLRAGEPTFSRPDDGTYPADGMNELCGSPVSWPEAFATYPTSSPAESPSPEPIDAGSDIGIGTNVCGVERTGGLDIVPGGDREVAWTGYLVNDEGVCTDRNPNNQHWIVAVDATGDAIADTWTDLPLVNCPYVGCWPLDATDLDGDGDGELIVTTGFSIQDHGYFAIEAGDGGFSIGPIEVAAPGHVEAGIEPGLPLTTAAGGDAGYSAWIRCEGYPSSPVLVFTSLDSVVDSDRPWLWHEVKLQLRSDGRFHVIDTTDLSLPPQEDPGLIRSDAPACGVDFTLFG